jgi:hypothetical protein
MQKLADVPKMSWTCHYVALTKQSQDGEVIEGEGPIIEKVS